MRIHVKLFAILRDRGGVSELSLDLADGASVSMALVRMSQDKPALREHLSRIATAVNQEYARPDQILRDGDELALIPPVSGGRA